MRTILSRTVLRSSAIATRPLHTSTLKPNPTLRPKLTPSTANTPSARPAATRTMSRYHAAHDATSGPGDARPTAMQVVQDEGLLNALPDKTVLVTGTSSGIGIPTVEALAATGATVFCTARNLAKGRDALAHVLKPGKVELIEMDNESLGSVRRGADEFLRRSGGKLNVLVANAGIMACPEAKSGDGHELQFATNHLAHFLLFQTVKDSLLRCSTGEFNSRVVLLSSMVRLLILS